MSLQKRLKKLQGGLKQADFIRKCGVPASTMKSYLTGRRKSIGNLDYVEAIAEANSVTPGWLQGGSRSPIHETARNDLLKIYELDPEVSKSETKGSNIIPTIKTYLTPSDSAQIYCIHCGRYHNHGEHSENAADHVISHCLATNSPFNIGGYDLEIAGYIEDAPFTHIKHDLLYCPNCGEIYSRAFAACECGYINHEIENSDSEIAVLYQTRITSRDKAESNLSTTTIVADEKGNIQLPPGTGLPHENSKMREIIQVPVLGKVPAGNGFQVSEDLVNDYISLPGAQPGQFALLVVGHSMEPNIKDGDYVLFSIEQNPIHNDVVVVRDEFGDPVIKRLKIKNDQQLLVSDNPDPTYKTLIPNGDYRVVGIVVKVWRDIKF